ncbi:MAG TPA: BTAD domain-containing putative transcriptional regulator, partial [Longimicrobiales bacterium]|nr:BTAD domain-containing putative transcriptional regulator [Longimicrobiales bacterium]
MLQLRLLGAIELQDSSGLQVDASILQPKRLGLLAYLVVATPGALFRRDDLAALFWPELDDQHARNSLSQILHQLRKALGPDVIATRGAAEIGVNPEHLWCDAVALEQALRRGAIDDAAELYRGDFLKGFHVDASPNFEQWLDQHREHLRARTAEALWKHVDANQHDPEAALTWARRAHALARGPDETAVRRLLHAFRAAGDISGGIHAYRAFERALADEFDASPSEETQRLHTDLLSTLGPARKEPRRHFGFGQPELRADTPQPQRPRRTLYALASLALIASAGLIAYLAMPHTSAAQAPPIIAVFPFQYRGPADDAYLGEGLARLVGSGVSASEAMRVIDAHTLSASLKNGVANLSQARARALANKFDADLVVTGEVVKVNRQLRITAHVMNTADDRAITHMVEGSADSAFALIGTLTARVVAASSRDASASIDVAANTTHSAAALKQFVEGDAAFRHGNYKEAVAHYSHAVADDSLFALAHYRLSRAANWTGEYATSSTAANRAVSLRSRLPEPMRSQVLAWSELMNGHVTKAEPLYRSILAEHPSEVDAVEDMAELSFHWGASVGHPVEESRALWERVLAIDANKADAIVHLLRVFARTRDLHAFELWQDKLQRLSPSADRQIEAKLLHAFAFGTDAQRATAASQ